MPADLHQQLRRWLVPAAAVAGALVLLVVAVVPFTGVLGGTATGVPDDELPAIAFAQHYADTGGHPDRLAWRTLVEDCGQDRATRTFRRYPRDLPSPRMAQWAR